MKNDHFLEALVSFRLRTLIGLDFDDLSRLTLERLLLFVTDVRAFF